MLEICCGSYYDAVQAALGGAKRIELNCGLYLGGLTPSLASLMLVKRHLPELKVIAMARPRGGGFCYNQEDYQVIEEDARQLMVHGADGIAFGCLNEDGSIDLERCRRLTGLIHEYGGEAVFHRAFDCTKDPYAAMEKLIGMGVDRVLTSGQKEKAMEGRFLLKSLQEQYGNQIQLLAGSGINASNARQLMEETGISQVHSSCKKWETDPTTKMGDVGYSFAGEPYEMCYDTVSSELVSKVLKAIKLLS